ncbi:MAG: hypothetical protein MUF01_18170 [Bryobacterales bacterium]|jgi:hypothetical protein|nr:hypothetical protein [Bryobacterales bacterium]
MTTFLNARPFLALTLVLLTAVCIAHAAGKRQSFSDFTTPLPLQPGDVLVLGIVGGWERWDAPRVVRLAALHVREQRWPGVYAETVENHEIGLAWKLVERAFDWNGNGALDADERAGVRLVLYGQSLGGSASMRFARDLAKRDIPVLLVAMIDSYGGGDRVVPPNVQAALNIYQRDHLFIKGENKISAQYPAKTRILGNHRRHYRFKGGLLLGNMDYEKEPLAHRVFLGSHLKIEYDEVVNQMLRQAILDAIPEDRKPATHF